MVMNLRIFVLSVIMFVLLSFSYILYNKLECKKDILITQERALTKIPMIERELKNLKVLLSNPEWKLIPSNVKDKYFKFISFLDLVSSIKWAKVEVSPVPTLSNVANSVYNLKISFETDNWGKLERLLRVLSGSVYPVVRINNIILKVENGVVSFEIYAQVILSFEKEEKA